MDDIDALVKMRLEYLLEANGYINDSDITAIKRDLPGYYTAHLNRDLFAYVVREGQTIVQSIIR